MVVLDWQLDFMILEVFSILNDSTILYGEFESLVFCIIVFPRDQDTLLTSHTTGTRWLFTTLRGEDFNFI